MAGLDCLRMARGPWAMAGVAVALISSTGCERRHAAVVVERVLGETAAGTVRANAGVVRLSGSVIELPALESFDESKRPEQLAVTVRRLEPSGRSRVLRYRSPGCGERIDLASGQATLGCPSSADRPARLRNTPVDLTLDRETKDGAIDRTLVQLGDGHVQAQVGQPRADSSSRPLELWATPAGLHLHYAPTSLAVIDTQRIVLETETGDVSLETRQEGGGVFRVGEKVTGRLRGAVRYRNGQLLFASRSLSTVVDGGLIWRVAVDPQLHTNTGVDFEVTFASSAGDLSWTEIDGRFRKSAQPTLQARLDEVAPDPAAPNGWLGADMRRMAESAFKQFAHSLRPTGAIRELGRTSDRVSEGAELVRVRLVRDRAPGEGSRPVESETTLAVLILDTDRFQLHLRHPCDLEKAGYAAINGYTFAEAAIEGQRLPDAGLLVDAHLVGKLRTDPWYGNLSIDDAGTPSLEAADRAFARGALPAATRELIQGTVYVRNGQSARSYGDNAEINWRSAIGLRHANGKLQILFAHTLLTRSGIMAGFTYGDGLTQHEMAELLLGFGIEEALILDGGPSAAMKVEGVLSSGSLRPTPVCIVAESRPQPASP